MKIPKVTQFLIFFIALGSTFVYFSFYTKRLHWTKVTEHAGWGQRDSAGEVVFNNKMWIIGGWDSSFTPGLRDVWNSQNGSEWEQIKATASWTHGDLSTTLVFQNKIWLMGGWSGGRLPNASASNQVWSSSDGIKWNCVSGNAEWSPRFGAAGVVFKNRMWMMGGTGRYFDGEKSDLKNDVWFSEDGERWVCATKQAPWEGRAFHCALVFDNKIWVMGGGNYLSAYEARNDVWNTEDGFHWNRITKAARWPGRIWFSAVEYRERMWILGGWSNNPLKNWNDVWYSRDGSNWKKLSTPSLWPERHEQSCLVYDDKIWVMGGNQYPLKNDVWYLEIPEGEFR